MLVFVFSVFWFLLAHYNVADEGVVFRRGESECFHDDRQQLCELKPNVWQTLWHCLETARLGLINNLLTQINGRMESQAPTESGWHIFTILYAVRRHWCVTAA